MTPTRLDLGVGAPLDLAGLTVTTGRWFGASAAIAHRLAVGEHQRRVRHGTGPVRSLPLLDALLGLPIGEPTPREALPASALRVLQAAPAGIVEFTDTGVVRHSVPPITPVLAVVRAAPNAAGRRGAVAGVESAGDVVSWVRAGLARAAVFAAYCPRLLLIPTPPAAGVAAEVFAEACWHGIGVAAGSCEAATTLVTPEAFTDWQPTPAWWAFTETVYHRWHTTTPN